MTKRKKGPTKRARPAAQVPSEAAPTRRGVSKTATVHKKLYPPYREWHRPLGWLLVALGISIVIVNDLAFVDINIMPGGHNELYLVLGLAVAGGGSYLLGAFSPN